MNSQQNTINILFNKANKKVPLKKLAVMTSGGDAPGMNAAIRAVVRAAIFYEIDVLGVMSGYIGMLNNEFMPLQLRSVANIIQKGGTMLKTGRCPEFMKPEGRARAAANLKAMGVEALACIGGDGSFRGADLLQREHGITVIGIPGTIDNDIFGTDNTIGFDTAVNTALSAIDKIRDTAASHDRLFIVEVMGRNSGFIASQVGVAGGAEEIFTPDHPITVDQAAEKIKSGLLKGKTSSIILAAEGQKPGRAYDLAEQIRKKTGFDAKVCILGHVQRGGSPTAADRVLASRLGAYAVQALVQGLQNVMIGTQSDQIVFKPLIEVAQNEKKSSKELLQLAQILSL